jgi:hypothetical protein
MVVHIYSSVKIWAPWNLEIGNSSLGPQVDCYNQGKIRIGANTVISQKPICARFHMIMLCDLLPTNHYWEWCLIAADAL